MNKAKAYKLPGKIISQQDLLPHIGKFFNSHPLLEGSCMAYDIMLKYSGSTKKIARDEHMLYFVTVLELIWDLHATWKASQAAKEIPMKFHIAAGDNVA